MLKRKIPGRKARFRGRLLPRWIMTGSLTRCSAALSTIGKSGTSHGHENTNGFRCGPDERPPGAATGSTAEHLFCRYVIDSCVHATVRMTRQQERNRQVLNTDHLDGDLGRRTA